MKTKMATALVLLFGLVAQADQSNPPLWGRVRVVKSMGDFKVKLVQSFPDLKVKVTNFPDEPGEWKFVEFGEDFTIEYVNFGEDLKIKFVLNFPGVN